MRTWGMSARTDTNVIPIIDGEAWDVTHIGAWTTTRYRRRSRRERFARSEFAAHLRAASRAAFWPAVAGSGYAVGLFLVDLTRIIL